MPDQLPPPPDGFSDTPPPPPPGYSDTPPPKQSAPLKPTAAFNGPQQIHQDYLNKWLPNLDSAPSKTYHDLINSDPSKWPNLLRGYSSVGRDALLFAAQAYKKQPTTMRSANAADTGRPIPGKTPLVYDPSDPLGYAQAKAQEQQAAGGFANQAVGKAKEFLAGSLDPRMLALELATGGAGSAIQGATGARALMQASPLLRAVPPAARATAGTVFGTQMARNAYQEYKAGRPGSAVVSGLAGLLGLAGAGKEILGKGSPALEPPPAANEPAVPLSARETPQAPSSSSAVWTVNGVDHPIKVTKYAGELKGRHYVNVEGSDSAVPLDQVTFRDANGKEYVHTGEIGKNGKPTLRPKETADAALPQEQIEGPGTETIRPGSGGESVAGGRPGPGAGNQEGVQEAPRTAPGQEAQIGDTTGIAQRVHEARTPGVIEPGVGTTPEAEIAKGREMLNQGIDPVKRMADLEAAGTNAISADDISLLRAEHERLSKVTNRAEDALRATPDDTAAQTAYDAAYQAETGWAKRIKPFQTEWHRIGQAQQGETDIDTGSFTGLRRYFDAVNKRDMTPTELKSGVEQVEKIRGLESTIEDLKTRIADALSKTPAGKKTLPQDPAKLREYFAAKIADNSLFQSGRRNKEAGALRPPGPEFTPSEIKAIWDYAKKTYIDPGNFDFNQMVNKTANDLGLKPEWVKGALSQNKTVRTMTDELFKRQYDRRFAVNAAKTWVHGANQPAAAKFLTAVNNVTRGIAVFGHGGVGMVTHAGPNIFRPSSWKSYWPAFFSQARMAVSKGFHEQMMQNIEQGPRYAMKLRAGLDIDPNRIYDDYQVYGKVMGGIGEAGNRGMDALKVFRDKKFDQEWEKLSPDLRTPDMAKLLADYVNGTSGVGSLGHGTVSNVARQAMFAPSLEAARWKRVLGDPIKTAQQWNSRVPEEQAIAKLRVKRAAELATVYTSVLAANYGLQEATGQKDKVNFTDPTKADWMRFKWNGRTLDMTGNATAPLRFMAQVLKTADPRPGYIEKTGETRLGTIAKTTEAYGRNKLTPLLGIAADVADQQNAIGRPMPFANEDVKKRAEAKGKPAYDWSEYAWEHAPIPVAGVAREFYDGMREQGASKETAAGIIEALKVLPFELVGGRVGTSKQPKSKLDLPPELKSAMKTPKLPTFQSMMRGQ